MHAGTEGCVLSASSFDGVMEPIIWRGGRSDTERKETEAVEDVEALLRNVAALHLKPLWKPFSEMWEVWMCHRVCSSVCVFSFQKRGQVCLISCVRAGSLSVCVCVSE